jgi:hypothetical protein
MDTNQKVPINLINNVKLDPDLPITWILDNNADVPVKWTFDNNVSFWADAQSKTIIKVTRQTTSMLIPVVAAVIVGAYFAYNIFRKKTPPPPPVPEVKINWDAFNRITAEIKNELK